jgi:hypothetical protein
MRIRNYLVPSLIFVCFAGLYIGISIYDDNYFLLQPVWDVAHYLSISEIGYEAYPCAPGVEFPAGKICGNVGWYPLWPLTVKLLRPLLGGSSRISFIGLAFIFTFLGAVIFFQLVRRHFGFSEAVFALSALFAAPPAFYFLSGFPYAMMFFLFAIYLRLFYYNLNLSHKAALFAVAMALSLTYPSGILFAVFPIVSGLIHRNGDLTLKRRPIPWKKIITQTLPFALGPLLLWGYFYLKFDDFFLQFHFQEKYQRTWAIPFSIIFRSLAEYPILAPENLTLIWYGLAIACFISRKARPEIWVTATAFFLFSPATGTTMSIYRHYLIIFPVYLMIGVSSRPLWLKALFILSGLAIALAVMFPQFIASRLI